MKEFYLFPILICSFLLAMIVITYQDKNTCNMNITMNNGKSFKARKVNWYTFGVVDITKCSDERIQVPTQTVKDVKFIK
jgi:hypothetical protein